MKFSFLKFNTSFDIFETKFNQMGASNVREN